MESPRLRDSMFWHLTNRGRISAVYYWLRRWFVSPPDTYGRCCMGGVVDPMVWCPRHAETDQMWCAHHRREIERSRHG